MSSIINGLIGAAIAAALTTYIAKRAGKAVAPGQLQYGLFVWALAFASLAFALLPVALTVVGGHDKDFWAKIALFVGFGSAALYCFGEAAFVRGRFDEDEIVFSTPWTGLKREKWKNLASLELNATCSWHTLTFRSGKKIRLSLYLGGHAHALDRAVEILGGMEATGRAANSRWENGASDGTRTHNPRDHNPVL